MIPSPAHVVWLFCDPAFKACQGKSNMGQQPCPTADRALRATSLVIHMCMSGSIRHPFACYQMLNCDMVVYAIFILSLSLQEFLHSPAFMMPVTADIHDVYTKKASSLHIFICPHHTHQTHHFPPPLPRQSVSPPLPLLLYSTAS